MAFEYSTIDEMRKLVEGIQVETTEFAALRARLWPVMQLEVTEDRIMLTELANRVDKLSQALATLCGILSSHLADEAKLEGLEE